ncbi:MAG: SDR family oxidoreductase [Actinobacteria bacterium]|nr:SDR family oxidoreductase [Actinomycetota bacterium]
MPILSDRVAIVTGSGRGVGRGIALALASAGAAVTICGRTPDTLEQTAAEITARGGRAITVVCDVTDPAQTDRLVSRTLEAFGRIDILVNNAQDAKAIGRLLDVDLAEFEQGFASGPLATLRLMRASHPHLCGDGVIVNLATSASLRPDPVDYGCYGANKEAIRTLSRAAAVQWASDGIRVHVIVPLSGLERFQRERPQEAREFIASIPLGRIGDAERDIGRAVVFLCGPDSSYMTGNTLLIDGGQAFLR